MKSITPYELKELTKQYELETLLIYCNEDEELEFYRMTDDKYLLCKIGPDIYPKDIYADVGEEILVLTKDEVPPELQPYII